MIGEVVLATRQTRYVGKITRHAQEMSDLRGGENKKKINDHVPVGITIANDYVDDVNNEIDGLSGRNKETPEFWMDRRVMAQKKQKTSCSAGSSNH